MDTIFDILDFLVYFAHTIFDRLVDKKSEEPQTEQYFYF